MTRRPQRTNSILQALKSMFFLPQNQRRSGLQRRTGFCASEFLESRELLSGNSVASDMSEFQVAPNQTQLNPARGFLTGPKVADPLVIANSFLRNNADKLGLTTTDIASLQLTNRYRSSGSGTTHLYFQQTVNGVPVISSNLNINVARGGQVINVGSTVLPAVSANTPAPAPTLTASNALDALVTKFNWQYDGRPRVLSSNHASSTKDVKLSSAGISIANEIPASLRYVPSADGTLELAWLLNVQTTDSNGWYDAAVSATDGSVLNVVDWMHPASYNAIEMPGENPLETPHSLIVDPQLRGNAGSPFGWHDTDGAVGAEFTDTRGNNVFAQEDKDADNAGGTRPDGGAGLVFNFPFDPAQGAVANENAAIVNLFYMNNVIHDVLYVYGFDEASGNFQFNNYGKGGLGGDQVIADALDGSGTNNANFATPPDGISGRMQMYEFTWTTPTRDSDLDNFIIVHEFGHGLTNRLTGGPANAGALQLDQSSGMGEGWSDFLGLMLVQKTTDTQAGAYSAGNYVNGSPLNDPLGGIRDFPYSVDMAISPKTYGYFRTNTTPHPNGEIIAATLWDLNWLMINGNGLDVTGKGYSADIYDAASDAGNTELMKVFVEALKLQPANPTFLDFRDAMLDADMSMNGGENEVAIWRAFARRGMGWSAFDGGSAASGNVREAFDLPPGLTLEFTVSPTSISEDAGPGSVIATIVRPTSSPISSPLVVTLTSSDVSEIMVPATVTIPAGRTSFTFPINVIDDTLLDGTQTVLITGTATIGVRLATAQASIQVLDYETLTITTSKTSIREDAGAGAAEITITRSNTDTAPPNTFAVINNRLVEYSPQGTLVRARTIPWPTGTRPTSQQAHDVVVMENGRVAVYNGSTDAYLSLLNLTTNTWQHIAIAGLSTVNGNVATGGISASGNYVFLSDTQAATGDEFGVVRVDVTTGQWTRFATQSPGYRLFIRDLFTNSIQEIDPDTGELINTIPSPTPGTFTERGLAFDGTNLWVLTGSSGDTIYKIDPNDGNVLEVHGLTGSQGWDGLAVLNGLLYALDDFIENQITVYDPIQRRVTNTLDVGTLNNINISGGLAGITGPNRLLVTSTFNGLVYEINPFTGAVTREWQSGLSFGQGLATANGDIYVGAFGDSTIRVFNRAGLFQRFMNVPASQSGFYALGGDNVETLVTTKYRYRDIYSGLDDKFYALDTNGVVVGRFNTTTLAIETVLTLEKAVNAIAVSQDGTVWGAGNDGILYHLDADGSLLGQRTIGNSPLVDIDLNISGQILLTNSVGRIYKTSTALGAPTSFSVGSTSAFVSSGKHQSLSGGDLVVQLTNSDSSEISIPSQVLIPAGQRSVTFQVDAVDDQELDGSQLVSITAAAGGYPSVIRRINVLDAEFVGVDIIAPSISESAGLNATQARVYRTDINGPFSFISQQSYTNTTAQTILDADKTTSKITVPVQSSTLTDVNVTLSLTHGFLADLDVYLVSPRGTRVELMTDIITNGKVMTATVFDDEANFSILTGSFPFTDTFRPEGQLLDLDGENPTGVWTLEITDDNTREFGTLLSWSLDIETLGLGAVDVVLTPTGDTDEIFVQRTVRIPANQSQVIIPLGAVDDNILDGTRVSGVSASTTTTGYRSLGDTVNVTDDETLTFTVSQSSVSEAAGSGAVIGTLTRLNSNLAAPFTVNLFSSDTTELTVASSVTIPAGKRSVTFQINAVDDNILDGTQAVTIRASAAAYGSDKLRVINVQDLEPSLLVSRSQPSVPTVREDAGSFIVTVTRQDQTNISASMTVSLSVINVSFGATPLTVPASVVIPANRISQSFTVTVNDDALLDGTQRATIRASSPNVISGSTFFNITDHETLTVTVDRPSIREDNGANAARGTVRRSNINVSQPLVVTLRSSDLSELAVPTTVVIPAGARSVQFDIDAVNDPSLDGVQTVTVSAAATGYYGGSVDMEVLDHEPPVVTAPAATVTNPLPQVKWNVVPNALRYDVLLQNLSTGIEQLYPDIVGTTFTPREQLGIGQYRAFVRAIDQLERDGFWSVARDFRVVTAPRVTSPNPRTTLVSGTFPEIAWTAIKDAAGYELTVNNLTTGRLNVISQKDLKTTSYRSVERLGSGVYTATVRAFNARKEFGQWSRTVQFSVLAAPGIIAPVTGGTFDRTPLITWNRIAGAVSYDIQLINVATQMVVYRDRYVTTLQFQVPQDLPNGNYSTSVRSQNGVYTSEWSADRLFSVGVPPAITAPGESDTVGGRPKFVWTGISGTERYEIWIQNVDTDVYVIKNSQITGTTFTPSTNLPLGKYETTVRAISQLGEITGWSDSVTVIAGATPTVTSPVNNIVTGNKPPISWSAVNGASSYIVQIFNLNTNRVTLTTARIVGTDYTVTTALPAGRYRVWVRAVSSAGYLSNWGTAVEFSVSSSDREKSALPAPDSDLLASALTEVMAMPGTKTLTVAASKVAVKAERAAVTVTSAAASTLPAAENIHPDESADASGMAAMFDAVMSGWDASDWWTTSV